MNVSTRPATLSAAEALATAPLFAELSSIDLARLVPELEECELQAGQVVFCQGDPGDGLYVIRSGTAEVSVPTPNGSQSVSTLEAPAIFGEAALLRDEPRSASVIARTPLSLWTLPRERFEALLDQHPRLAVQIAAALAGRLTDVTERLSASQEQVVIVARAAYDALDPPAQALLRRAAVFAELDAELLRALLGSAWSPPTWERLVQEGVFLQPTDRAGWVRFVQASLRGFLLHQLRAEVGGRGLRDWQRRAADLLLARDDAEPEQVLELLAAAGEWRRLARLIEEQGSAIAEQAPESVEGYLRVLPPRLLWRRPRLVCLWAECCAAQGKLEQAIEVYHGAERRDPAARGGPLALTYQQALAGLHEKLGQQEEGLACLRRVHQLRQQGSDLADREDGNAQLHTGLSADVIRAEHRLLDGDDRRAGPRLSFATLQELCEGRMLPWRGLVTIGILGLTALAWFLPPPAGLSDSGLRVLATIVALVALSFLDVLPDYLLGLLMLAAWIVTGTLPASVAVAGFGNPTWFLLLASMAIGAAVERSGLLYRGAIELVRHLPSSHTVRCLTLAGLGVLFSPGMPSPNARLLLAAPLARDIADSLRYPPHSGGSAGLALATFVGFALMGSLFLTGNALCLLVYGLFPPEVQARMSWVDWFLAGLPTHLALFVLTMLFVLARYRPERDEAPPEGTLALQRRVLGPLSRDEWSALLIVGLILIGFSTQSLHGIDPAWLAVAAVAALFLTGTLDDSTFKHGVNLSFLLYVGVVFGFGAIFAHVELDRWLSQNLGVLAQLSGGSPTLFVLAVAGIAALLGLLLRPGPIALLLALALFQTAATVGVDPWVVAITVILATNLWLYPQQNVLYLTAYYATEERAFTHAQARPLAIAYAAFVFLAILISIPYWRWIGLIA
ncbi:MAG: anion permease [Chloroflexi bacterium]|nr:anion permease [Chloroflexota bacterium]